MASESVGKRVNREVWMDNKKFIRDSLAIIRLICFVPPEHLSQRNRKYRENKSNDSAELTRVFVPQDYLTFVIMFRDSV